MADDQRKPEEAKRLEQETLRRMLGTRPEPRMQPKPLPKPKKRK